MSRGRRWPGLQPRGGGRFWWAPFEFTRKNVDAPTILRKKRICRFCPRLIFVRLFPVGDRGACGLERALPVGVRHRRWEFEPDRFGPLESHANIGVVRAERGCDVRDRQTLRIADVEQRVKPVLHWFAASSRG